MSCSATGANRKLGLDPLLGQWLRGASAELPSAAGSRQSSLRALLSRAERLWASAASKGFAPRPSAAAAAAAAGDDRHPTSSPPGIYSWPDRVRYIPFPASVQVWGGEGGRGAPSVLIRQGFRAADLLPSSSPPAPVH